MASPCMSVLMIDLENNWMDFHLNRYRIVFNNILLPTSSKYCLRLKFIFIHHIPIPAAFPAQLNLLDMINLLNFLLIIIKFSLLCPFTKVNFHENLVHNGAASGSGMWRTKEGSSAVTEPKSRSEETDFKSRWTTRYNEGGL
jgi:hypothetical protein